MSHPINIEHWSLPEFMFSRDQKKEKKKEKEKKKNKNKTAKDTLSQDTKDEHWTFFQQLNILLVKLDLKTIIWKLREEN